MLVGVLASAGCAPDPAPTPTKDPISLAITDVEADRIQRFDLSFEGATLSEVAWEPLTGPAGIAPSDDGEWLFVTSFVTHELLRLEAGGGDDAEVLFRDTAVIEEPVALIEDGDSFLLLGNDTGNVARIGADGEVLSTFGEGFLRQPHDFALGPDGLLYVANAAWRHDVGLIQVFDPETGERVRDFALPEVLLDAVGLAFDRDGTLLVADWFGARVLRFDAGTGELLETVLDADDGVDAPLDVTVTASGELLFLDRADVVLFDGDGLYTLVDGAEAGLDWPRGLELLR